MVHTDILLLGFSRKEKGLSGSKDLARHSLLWVIISVKRGCFYSFLLSACATDNNNF